MDVLFIEEYYFLSKIFLKKKIFLNYYILPEHLMFFRGLGELVLFIIFTPIFYSSIWNKDPNYFELASNVSNIILIAIIYILSCFIKSYIVIKVIYNCYSQSVSFLIISESITYSIAEIINFFISDNRDFYFIIFLLIDILVIIITAIGTLVYEEILVINKCGLDSNIAQRISSRAFKDINYQYYTDSEYILEIGDVNVSEEKRQKSREMPEI